MVPFALAITLLTTTQDYMNDGITHPVELQGGVMGSTYHDFPPLQKTR
jgi:hypothetical protein